MIFFSPIYCKHKEILYNSWLYCYFNFEEIFKRIRIMIEELLLHNGLIDYHEAIRILIRDNSESLKGFKHSDIRRYIQ